MKNIDPKLKAGLVMMGLSIIIAILSLASAVAAW